MMSMRRRLQPRTSIAIGHAVEPEFERVWLTVNESRRVRFELCRHQPRRRFHFRKRWLDLTLETLDRAGSRRGRRAKSGLCPCQ
jgi:hypothetical protein